MTRFRPAWTVALVVLAVIAQACANQGNTNSGGPVTLRIAYPVDPRTFNGVLNYMTQSGEIDVQIYNRLLTYDKDFNLVADLADSWNMSSDGQTYTFHLHPGVKWHDGQPFTSDDVKFTFETVKQLALSPGAKKISALSSIDTPDANTVIFHFSSPTRPSVFANLDADTFILPKHIYDHGDFKSNPANLHPIGTGAFRFVSYTPGVSVILDANKDYFKGKPKVDRLVFTITTQPAAALLALRAGNVDTIEESLGVPATDVASLRNSSKYEVGSIVYYTVLHLDFNQRPEAIAKYPWLNNRDVRVALMEAIDRDYLVKTALAGVTTRTDTAISNTIKWAYSSAAASPLYDPPYDPKDAAKRLDAAGYPVKSDGTRFSFTSPVAIWGGGDQVAPAMAQMWKQIGVAVTAQPIELNAFIDQYYGNNGLGDVPMAITGDQTGPDPIEINSTYSSTNPVPNGNNWNGYHNAQVDQLLAEATTKISQADQKPLYDQVQIVINQDAWFLQLYNNYHIEVWSKCF